MAEHICYIRQHDQHHQKHQQLTFLRKTHLFHSKHQRSWKDWIIVGPVLHTGQIMSRVEAFGDSKPRSLLRELRTDIAMAVDDSFPLVYGLADKNIITDQLLKVSDYIWKMSAVFLLLPNFQQYIKIGFWDKYCFFELLKCQWSWRLQECIAPFVLQPFQISIGHSGERGPRRNPQGHVLAPVLAPGAEKIHHPDLLEQLV